MNTVVLGVVDLRARVEEAHAPCVVVGVRQPAVEGGGERTFRAVRNSEDG